MLPMPHGGKLVEIRDMSPDSLDRSDYKGFIEVSYETAVTVMDIKNGVLSPITGFVEENDYHSILNEQRLENGTPWSIPIMMGIGEDSSGKVREGDTAVLSYGGNPIAEIEVSQLYRYDKRKHSESVFGTNSADHPGVAKVQEAGNVAVAGKITAAGNVTVPFISDTLFPKETRKIFSERGWTTVSAFQTRNVPHRGHEQIQRLSLRSTDGLFINPVIGRKKKGDYTDEAIMKAYSALVESYYPPNKVLLTPLHYEMMYAGPREAVMHAIMRKNFGCSHFIVGRDHAGVGSFYGPYEAQENLRNFNDLGISIVPFEETFYCRKCEQLVTDRECAHPSSYQERFSGTKLREIISSEQLPPPEVMRLEVYNVIKSMPEPFVR